jgi:predicted Na+-dependent transporter
MLQAPLLGGMVDTSILNDTVGVLWGNFRIIIFAAFVGNLIGAILTPFAVAVFTRAIKKFNEIHSVPRLILYGFRPVVWFQSLRDLNCRRANHSKDYP